MTTKLTREVLEAHLHCRFKGHLKQTGQTGTRSDYEAMLLAARDQTRLRAIDKIVSRHEGVIRNVPFTASTLKRGPSWILDATLEDDACSLRFDALKRVDGPSQLGDYHYVPVLFHEGEKVRKEQRLLLEVYGVLLARIQGRTPGHGFVLHGKEGRPSKVRFNPDPRKAERVLRDLQGSEPPRLVLNDHCQVCEFSRRCHDQAVKDDNLSLLRSLGEKEVKGYARKGTLTLTQLAHTFRPRRKGKRAVRTHRRYHALQALAIRDKRVYVFGTPELSDSPVKVYLDIEGVPDEDFVYLIGMLVVRQGKEERFSFWADRKEREQEMFAAFLAEVSRYEDFRVYCYGSYERAFLRRMRKGAKRKKPVDRVLERLVNVLSLVYAHVYFPAYSNGLKDVAGCLGCSWTEPGASGVQSLVWRANWEATKDDEWKQKLLTYNREDCIALRTVSEFARSLAASDTQTGHALPADERHPAVERVQDAASLPGPGAWAYRHFSDPDYKYINRCASFDYQRERVYARTSSRLRRVGRRGKRPLNRTLRVNKHVDVYASPCPRCGGTDLQHRPRGKRVRRAFDLAITPSGIKRKVIECHAPLHTCLGCGHQFMPEQYRRLDKHYHGLKCWAMYYHVGYGIGYRTLEEMTAEHFGIRVYKPEFKMLQSLLARRYRVTYRRLLKSILAGPVLHVDETEVNLRTGKAYVWVFTNLEEVVFMHRPSREGGFLRGLLKDFRGVLVSDFYAPYDSLDCPQQKCLLHLVRDMNDDLLGNPFDDDLRAITRPFGALLRSILTTVDRHGLKRNHLRRHATEVDSFFRSLHRSAPRSEAAAALQKRLLKYEPKLFTFIEHDGVPWNNNNAENAIKRFASYRVKAGGRLTEAGLKEFLVLLSICHTCRYKGVSFLKFLLSRVEGVDQFCEGKRRARRSPAIEVYPKGFVPPHLCHRQGARSHRVEEVAGGGEPGENPAPFGL